MSGIHFEASYDDSRLDAGLKRSNQKISEWARDAAHSGQTVEQMFGRIQSTVAAFASIEFARRIGAQIIDVRGELESLQISFETLAGKAEGLKLFNDVKDYTLSTPLLFQDLAKGAQTLLSFNIAAKDVMPTLKQIGDISLGDSQKFNSLTLAFAQMSATGRLMGQDLLQMINGGFNPLVVISEKTGKSLKELKKDMEAGAISSEMVADAFKIATSEGGKFFGMLDKQSQGIKGSISNLQGAIDNMFNDIGEDNQSVITSSIAGLTDLVNNYENVLGVLKTLAVGYGTYKAVLILISAYESAAAKIEASRISIIEAKVAALIKSYEAEDAAATAAMRQAEIQQAAAAVEELNASKRNAAAEKTLVAREALAIATDQLAAAELRYSQLSNLQSLNATTKLKVEESLKDVKKARVEFEKASMGVESALSAETAVNAQIEAEAVAKSEAEKIAAKKAGIRTDRERMVASQAATNAEVLAAQKASILSKLMTGANPYIFAAVGIMTLVTALNTFNKKIDSSGKAFSEFKGNLNDATKEIDSNFKKLNETSEGTKQRQKAIEDINSKYGEYLTNLLDEKSSLEDIKKAQEEATVAMAKDIAFKAQKKAIEDTKEKADEAATSFYSLIQGLSASLTNEQSGQFKAAIDSYLTTLQSSFEKTGKFASISAENIRSIFESSGGELTLMNSGSIQETQYAAQTLVRTQTDVANSTKNLEEQYNSYLEALGLTGKVTTDADEATKDTVAQQIKDTKKALEDAQTNLDNMRKADSTSTFDEIQTQSKLVSELSSKLETLTGIKRKEAQKQVKDEQDKIKALQELADKELELTRNLEESKISVLRDGIQKQEQETTLSYKRRLDEIKKSEEDYLKVLNGSKGLEPTDKAYVKVLPSEIQAQFDQQRDLTTEKYYQDLATLSKDAADEIKDIWREASDDFISEQDRQKQSINDKYNEMIKKAKEAGASDTFIANLDEKRHASLSQVVVIDWIEAFGDLDKVSTDALEGMRDKLKEYMSQISGSVPKDELKDIVEAFDEIDAKIRERSPFESLSDSTKEYKFQTQKLDALKKQLEYYKEQGAEAMIILRLEKQIKDTTEDQTEARSKLNKDINNVGSDMQQLVGAGQDVIGMLEDMGVSISDSTRQGIEGIGKMVDALAEIDLSKPMSIITSSIKFTAGLVKSITGFFGGGNDAAKDTAELNRISERTQAVYEQINKLLESRIDLIREATGAEAAYLDTLNQQTIEQQKQWQEQRFELLRNNELFGKAGKNNDLSLQEVMDRFGLSGMQEFVDWYNSGGAAELLAEGFNWTNQDSWDQFIQNWNDLTDAEKESAEAAKEAITGISFDSLKDSLDDLITSTDTVWGDVADSFEDHMRKAILNFVKSSYLTDQLQQWYDQFSEYMSNDIKSGDNELTQEEKDKLKELYGNIYQTGQDMYDAALSAAGVSADSSSSTGLTGQISRSITEDTASELVGLWNRTALDTRSIRDYMLEGISHLVNIEANTYNTVIELQKAVVELKQININTQSSGSRI